MRSLYSESLDDKATVAGHYHCGGACKGGDHQHAAHLADLYSHLFTLLEDEVSDDPSEWAITPVLCQLLDRSPVVGDRDYIDPATLAVHIMRKSERVHVAAGALCWRSNA